MVAQEDSVGGGQGVRCSGLGKSSTDLTGANVSSGTSTKTVFQPAMAPFQRPGRSSALRGRPSCDLLEMKTVVGSTKLWRSYGAPLRSRRAQTTSTGLKWVDPASMSCRTLGSICELSTI